MTLLGKLAPFLSYCFSFGNYALLTLKSLFVGKVCNKYSLLICLLLQYAPTDWPCRGNLFETKRKEKTWKTNTQRQAYTSEKGDRVLAIQKRSSQKVHTEGTIND